MNDAITQAIEALSAMLEYTADMNPAQGYDDTDHEAVKKAAAALAALRAQPAPPPECQTEAEKTAYAFGWWKALESVRAQPDHSELVKRLRGIHAEAWDSISRITSEAADALEGKPQ